MTLFFGGRKYREELTLVTPIFAVLVVMKAGRFSLFVVLGVVWILLRNAHISEACNI